MPGAFLAIILQDEADNSFLPQRLYHQLNAVREDLLNILLRIYIAIFSYVLYIVFYLLKSLYIVYIYV